MANSNCSPLLLLDNSTMISVVKQGEFRSSNLSFHEAKSIVEMYEDKHIIKCFSNLDIENIIFNYLGIARRDFEYQNILNMRPNQDAIVFKLYTTPSETQPVITTMEGVEAKKIQNIYVYCQLLSRIK